jgi:hypothetical protein
MPKISELKKCQMDFYKECSENICKNYWQLSNENKFIWIMSNDRNSPNCATTCNLYFKMFQTYREMSVTLNREFNSSSDVFLSIFLQCYILHTCQNLILVPILYKISISTRCRTSLSVLCYRWFMPHTSRVDNYLP